MEDSLSVKSNESLATSEEFDFIGEKPGISRTPTLDVNGGDFNELQNALREVLQEQEINMSNVIEENRKEIGKSTFYVGPMSSNLSPTEKQDSMKSGASSDEEVLDVDQDCTIFAGVTYLGPALINAPKSEVEIKRHMSNLNEQNGDLGLKVSVSVPCSSTGVVVLYDATTNSVIARYEIHRILFYARGGINTPEAGCFAFTWSHGDSLESAIFQCHIFRCDIGEAVSRVSACFSKAFQRVPRSMSSSITSACDMNSSITTLSELRTLLYVFEVNLEIKEDDGKGSYSTVGKDKQGFKLKVNTEKQLCLSIRQVSDNGPQLLIERCFGLLVAAGKHVRHSDMQLLEMDETTSQNNICVDKNCSFICAAWDPTEPNFELLNCETPKDVKQFLSVAVDLVIQGIREPVRFQIETLVRVLGQNERNFWYFQRKTLVQQFYLNLKEVPSPDSNDVYFEVLSMESSGELDRNLLNLNLISNLIPSPSINSIETTTPKDEYYSDGDEPLLSGTGLVSKDCSKDVLEQWAEVLNRWKSTQQRPKQLTSLVKIGIPEALRGEVWQRLAGVEQANNMMDNYRILITQESSCESVIKRDIARTFPAHDFFKEAGGLGQDSLYRVSKAYAVHDTEVGYCQGLSFLAATLLLHMPEEQAFCVLDKLMYDYGLRDLYKDGFDNLYLRLYQLNKLMEEQQSSLWNHFNEHNIETHMFASQWFLTLFTARFPLFFVFHIIDIFLLQGIDTIFQIALALLMQCKKDLLLLDFEGILKYFRVSLPKKCRTEESAKNLIKLACSIKVKKLKKYETEFNTLKEAADNQNVQSEADQLRLVISRYDEDEKLMAKEISQLKEMLKREATRADNEKLSNMTIINDYNLVRQRMEAQVLSIRTELDNLKCKISECDQCSQYLIVDNKKPEQRASGGQVITDDERVKELELELAQTKLAHVEAECKNQDLTHKLRSAELELNTAKNTWTPWLSKTLTSIKEVANKKDFSHFNYSSINPTATFISHVNSTRRESVPAKKEPHQNIDGKDLRRDSVPIMQDSQSCSNLKGTHI